MECLKKSFNNKFNLYFDMLPLLFTQCDLLDIFHIISGCWNQCDSNKKENARKMVNFILFVLRKKKLHPLKIHFVVKIDQESKTTTFSAVIWCVLSTLIGVVSPFSFSSLYAQIKHKNNGRIGNHCHLHHSIELQFPYIKLLERMAVSTVSHDT